MFSLKTILSFFITILVSDPGSSAFNIEKGINKRAAEVSANVQRYSFNQNHPPFAEDYAPIPVAIFYEEPSRNTGNLIATTEKTPTTFHPRFRNLVVVSTDVAKEVLTLNSKSEEISITSTSSENVDNMNTVTVDENKKILVKGKYDVDNELQIPVAVIYDTEYTDLRSNSKVEDSVDNIAVPDKSKDQKDERREITDTSKSDQSSESKTHNEPRTGSYDKVISRRKPQSQEKLDVSTEPTFTQANAQKMGTEDTKRVNARTQQRRRQRPTIETESTTGEAVVPKIDNQASSDTRSITTLSNGNPRRRLQPKTTVVNETATDILKDKTVGKIKSDFKSTEILQNDNNLGDIKIKPQKKQLDVVEDVKYENIKEISNFNSTPQQRRKPVTPSHDVKSNVNLQTNEDVTSVSEKSENVQQGTMNPTTTQQRRRQPFNNTEPDTTYTSKNQENNGQTLLKKTPSEIFKQNKQSNDEILVSVALQSPNTESIQDKYQNPPQRKKSNIELVSLNADKTAKKSETVQKGTRNPTTAQPKSRQTVNNPKPDTTYTSKNQESNEPTSIKNTPSGIVKQSNDETPVTAAHQSVSNVRIQDKYQNLPQRKQPSIESVSSNSDKTTEKSETVLQVTTNLATIQQRRRQPVNNPKPDTTYMSKNAHQDNVDNEQTTIKNTPSEIIKQDQRIDETLVSVSLQFPTTERLQEKYQNLTQRKQPNIKSVSLNAVKLSETNTRGQPVMKGSGFPEIVSTTNSRTQPQRRRQSIKIAKQDNKADDVIVTQISDITKEVSIQSSSESSVTVTSEAVKKSRQRDPVVPIVESENHVYGNTGEFHYSYESGDGTKQYGDGVLKPNEEDVNGESVVGGFSYTDKDGNDFSLTYTADENGYRPVGAHLPTPPPIPPAIARALAFLATKTTPTEYDEVTESL